MDLRAQPAQEPENLSDVALEAEFAFLKRHVAGVPSVGDADRMVRHKPCNHVLQQHGVLTGKGRDHKYPRCAAARWRVELPQGAERFPSQDALAHLKCSAVACRGREVKVWSNRKVTQAFEEITDGHHRIGRRLAKALINCHTSSSR